MNRAIHICRFDSVLDMFERRKGIRAVPTYAELKEAVLKAGRYSSFEAAHNQRTIAFFERLDRDPELICTRVGFPWIKVERKPER